MADSPNPIYLDHNASTPVLPEVLETMLPYLQEHYGNPSSTHRYGQIMRDAVEKARHQVAALIGASSGEVYFTSGGTEANNLAIRGTARANPTRRHIVSSVIEHPATTAPCECLRGHGYTVDLLEVDSTGRVIPGRLTDLLNENTLLVTVMHANSETGTLQSIDRFTGPAHAVGALVHTDAAQSVGKVPVSVRTEEVDLLSLAGHKLYAPQGVGALYVRAETEIKPLVLGAGHERGLRPGTENVASIAGLGKACAIAQQDLSREGERVRNLRERLWARLADQIPGLQLNGHPVDRLPGTLNVRFPGVSGHQLLSVCPTIAASTGSACHEAGVTASAVIRAMGIPEQQAIGSVRLTLGRNNDENEIDRAANTLIMAWKSLEKSSHGERAI